MDISRLKVGILHSLIGKNDGVSIVIDQTIKTMVKKMDIPLGNIFYLAGHSPPRMNTALDDVFWHRNEDNRYILEHYNQEPPEGFEDRILQPALYAKTIIADFIEENGLDVFIVHNSCHPSNFIFAVAVGMYFEERRAEGLMLPRYLLWWHDSHFERKRFADCNENFWNTAWKATLKHGGCRGTHLDAHHAFLNTAETYVCSKEEFDGFDGKKYHLRA